MRSTGDDIWQTALRTEQSGESRLPLPGSHRRQAAAPVAPLTSSETAGHLQGGFFDSQGAGHNHSGVPQRPGTDPRTNTASSFIQRSPAGHSPDTHRTRSACFYCCSSIHLELFTLDCARAFPYSRATWKCITWKCIGSDPFSPPVLQAPLYLLTSRCYTNVLLLLVLLLLLLLL